MERKPLSIDEYMGLQPVAVRAKLEKVRAIIRSAVPEAEETISYGMPAYKLHGRIMLYFAGWKEHLSLYPGNGRLVAELADELKQYEVRKGTIQFPLDKPVPAKLITRIAKYRANQEAEKRKAETKKAGRLSRSSRG
jgi:uncharacterized protein YdhG (YjbR/CyaY superfamily)